MLVLSPLAPGAAGHVEVKPKRAPAGSTARILLIAENERDPDRTVKIETRLPGGSSSARPRAIPGWTARLQGRVATWEANRPSAGIAGHESRRFPLSIVLPAREGPVAFKTLQTYAGGAVVRWIQPPGSAEPAPRLILTAAKSPPADTTGQEESPGPAAGAADEQDDDSGLSATVIVLIVLGGLAALVAAALLLRRRGR